MSNMEWDLPFDRDSAERYERDLEAEQREYEDRVVRERLYEHRPARPDPKPAKRVTRKQANRATEAMLAWRETVFSRDQGCVYHANPAACAEGWECHHVLPQQLLRRDHPAQVWDPRVGVCLCGLAHRQFHAGFLTITREDLPLEVWMHCYAMSPDHMRKHYPPRKEVAA